MLLSQVQVRHRCFSEYVSWVDWQTIEKGPEHVMVQAGQKAWKRAAHQPSSQGWPVDIRASKPLGDQSIVELVQSHFNGIIKQIIDGSPQHLACIAQLAQLLTQHPFHDHDPHATRYCSRPAFYGCHRLVRL